MSLLDNSPRFPNRRICMLMVTHACNLNCTYCYEVHKSNQYMSYDIAVSILKKELEFVKNSSGKFKEIEVEFMGGEPFMAFPLIQRIVLWMKENAGMVPWVSSCSTNGTLVTDDKKPWLVENKKWFIPCLSYDGDSEMQEINRRSGHYAIDTRFFLDTWPMQHFHMTISKETLPMLANGVLSIQRLGGQVDLSLAQGIEWDENDTTVFRKQLEILSKAYLEDETLPPNNMLSRYMIGIPAKKGEEQKKFCGTGTHMVAYDIDGKPYPCHMFTPVVLGDIWDKERDNHDFKNGCEFEDPYCSECLYKNWCPTCCGFNLRFRGSLSKRDHGWCKMIAVQAQVTCEFQLMYYKKHKCKLSRDDLLQLEGAINTYQALTTRNGEQK